MNNTRTLVLGVLLAGLAVIFQLMPVFLSEAVIFLTVLSTVPIYVIARTAPRIGITAYVITGIVISIINIHEGLIYVFTNGIIGLALGIGMYNTRNRVVVCALTALLLAVTLNFLHSFIGIPVLGIDLPEAFLVRMIILLVFSAVYAGIALCLLEQLMKKVNRYGRSYTVR